MYSGKMQLIKMLYPLCCSKLITFEKQNTEEINGSVTKYN